MSTDTLLDRYNDLREKRKLPRVRIWSGTTESLQDAYDHLNGSSPNGGKPPVKIANRKLQAKHDQEEKDKALEAKTVATNAKLTAKKELPETAAPLGDKTSKELKKSPVKHAFPGQEEKKKAIKDAGGVTLADICARLKIEPRAARIRLRAAYVDGKGLPKKIGDQWAWKADDVKKIEGIIKPAAKS